MNTRVAAEVQHLLDELCVDLGFCLPPDEQQRLRTSPPDDVGTFAAAVFTAEGLDPGLHKQLYRSVIERITRRIGRWTNEPDDEPST